jgi:hypothetical protein
MNEDRYRIVIAASHHEPKQRVNGIAPSGYSLIIAHGEQVAHHFGFGGERSTEAMFAHGLVRATTKIFIECETPHITVVAAKIGTGKYITDIVPLWLKKIAAGVALSKDNERTWRDLHALSLMGDLILRLPESEQERSWLCEVQAHARDVKEHVYQYLLHHPELRGVTGVFATDEELTNVGPSEAA